MQYVLTTRQMREADEYTIRTLGMPSLVLMERAGEALAAAAEKMCPKGDIVCVCGGGNNGGDGFVCARILAEKGRRVAAVCVADKFTPECRTNKEKFEKAGGEVFSVFPRRRFALAVDCLFGTGFRGEPEGKAGGGDRLYQFRSRRRCFRRISLRGCQGRASRRKGRCARARPSA